MSDDERVNPVRTEIRARPEYKVGYAQEAIEAALLYLSRGDVGAARERLVVTLSVLQYGDPGPESPKSEPE